MAYWKQVWQIYPLLPMKTTSILPDEGFNPRYVELRSDLPPFLIRCTPPNGGKHRLLVACSCGREIPVGRMHQHWKSHS